MSLYKVNIISELSHTGIILTIRRLFRRNDVQKISVQINEEVQKTLKEEQENIKKFIYTTTDDTIFKIMSDKGLISDVDIVDKGSWTALEFQIKFGSITGVKCLLKLGANPNKKNINGNTPLHQAAYSLYRWNRSDRPMDILKLLMDYGADKTITNNHGQTSLDIIDYDYENKRISIKSTHINFFKTYSQKMEDIYLLKKINVRKKSVLIQDVLRIICDFM